MAIVGHGLDIIECARVARVLSEHADRFLERVLTPAERDRASELHHNIPHIAGRFAAKEAVLKVLGTGWRGGIAWTDMEITNDALGQPVVALSGECARRAGQLGITRIVLSISHTANYAAASAIGVQ